MTEKRVRFSYLDICELKVRLGDHPCSSDGLAVELGDDIIRRYRCFVDVYEEHKPQRRSMGGLKLDLEAKFVSLVRSGLPLRAIEEIVIRANATRIHAQQLSTLLVQRQLMDDSDLRKRKRADLEDLHGGEEEHLPAEKSLRCEVVHQAATSSASSNLQIPVCEQLPLPCGSFDTQVIPPPPTFSGAMNASCA